MSFVKTAITIIVICLTVTGYLLEMEGITEGNKEDQKLVFGIPGTYVSFGIIANGIVVIYLLSIIIMNYNKLSISSIVTAFVLLLGLFIVEIGLSVSNVKLPSSIPTYIIITLNFLVRMYYILEFQCVSGEILYKPALTFTKPAKPSTSDKSETPKETPEEYEARKAANAIKQAEYEKRKAEREAERLAYEAMTPEEQKAKRAADRARKEAER